MALLAPGDVFPSIAVTTPGDEALTVPEVFDEFGVILFNRGSWCPYCNAQLQAFQLAQDSLAEVGATVVSLSVDDEATTAALIAKHRLTFPVGHSADARAIAAATGAFIHDDPLHLQSTGFIVGPDGRVLLSVYSSGAIGRLVPDDVVGMLRYVRAQQGSAA